MVLFVEKILITRYEPIKMASRLHILCYSGGGKTRKCDICKKYFFFVKHPKYSCCECHVAIRQPLWPFKDFAPFKGGLPLSAHFLLSSDKYWGGIFVYKQNIILDIFWRCVDAACDSFSALISWQPALQLHNGVHFPRAHKNCLWKIYKYIYLYLYFRMERLLSQNNCQLQDYLNTQVVQNQK